MMGAIIRAASVIRRITVGMVAGGALCVIIAGTAYVVASDSGELGPVPVVHLTPRPSPAP
jgi:hypothetical protein